MLAKPNKKNACIMDFVVYLMHYQMHLNHEKHDYVILPKFCSMKIQNCLFGCYFLNNFCSFALQTGSPAFFDVFTFCLKANQSQLCVFEMSE